MAGWHRHWCGLWLLGGALLAIPARCAEPGAVGSAHTVNEVGLASWYGAQFHQRLTASGELFDMQALTAAHPRLPFGSRVCVYSQGSGRTVLVRINDRGPYSRKPVIDDTHKRVIDLSRAAAEALGMVGPGLKPVQLSGEPCR